MIFTRVKVWKAPMVLVTRRKNNVGDRQGMVIALRVLKKPAPSIDALSYSSMGIPCKPE
jgi:hypothetical protein